MKPIIELKHIIIALIMAAMGATGAKASAPWAVNASDYQYDMTLYLEVEFEDGPMDYSKHTVAAFCGDECRGIAEPQEHNGSTWLYLRARSNEPSGETMTYKYYSEETGKAENIEDASFEFVCDSQVGWPSSPEKIVIVPPAFILGDANGDGSVSVSDAVVTVEYTLNNSPANFNFNAADVNKDNKISVTDVVGIVNIVLGINN